MFILRISILSRDFIGSSWIWLRLLTDWAAGFQAGIDVLGLGTNARFFSAAISRCFLSVCSVYYQHSQQQIYSYLILLTFQFVKQSKKILFGLFLGIFEVRLELLIHFVPFSSVCVLFYLYKILLLRFNWGLLFSYAAVFCCNSGCLLVVDSLRRNCRICKNLLVFLFKWRLNLSFPWNAQKCLPTHTLSELCLTFVRLLR